MIAQEIPRRPPWRFTHSGWCVPLAFYQFDEAMAYDLDTTRRGNGSTRHEFEPILEAKGWTRQIADGGPTMTEFLQQQPDFTGLVGCFRHMAAVRSGVLLDDVYGSGDNLAYYWVPPSE